MIPWRRDGDGQTFSMHRTEVNPNLCRANPKDVGVNEK
jgi:hypothetical protein